MADFETINIQDLKPAEYNPRYMPEEEMNKLRNNLQTFGLVDPIIIDLTDNNTVIGGHQRLEALKEIDDDQDLHLLKLGDIGLVFRETHLKIKDKNDQKALNLSLNKINGEWDYSKLDDLLLELNDDNYQIELTGFDNLEMYEISLENDIDYDFLREEEELSDVEDEARNCSIKQGDLYQVGDHKICCAKELDEQIIKKLIGDSVEGIIFTDPSKNKNLDKQIHKFYPLEENTLLCVFEGGVKALLDCENEDVACLLCVSNPLSVQTIINNFEETTGIKASKL